MAQRPQRIVLKFGSGILATKRGVGLSRPQIARLAREVGALVRAGHRCIIVSSGAVAAGLATLGLATRPKQLAAKQACAAVGQSQLMHVYANAFARQGLAVAQLLLFFAENKIHDQSPSTICAMMLRWISFEPP